MISSEDVRRVTFDKAMRGYRCDDVDDYLKQVAESMDALAAKNDEMQKNLVVLAQRIDQYRAEEDTLRTTMINAQRLGENVIREAKQKAAEIIRAANMKADDREQRARDDVELAKQEIVTLKSEADSFKRSLMEMYRKHINLISKSFHIIIHAFCIHQLKKVLIDSCIFFINVASGSIPCYFHIFMSQKETYNFISRITGCSNNSSFYHFSVLHYYGVKSMLFQTGSGTHTCYSVHWQQCPFCERSEQ